ncbi:DUF6265 family protein [Fulvivirga sp.]|uniref:DUF6265 family protein n=1 Tax=Fulvivirga sp. TaxID=1931237 RepID=UPI0032EC7C6F
MKATNSLGTIMAVAISFLLINPVSAQEKEFDINDYQWLVGHWVGDGFGGVSEEMWAPPVDGVMMGMYRNVQNGKVSFYEFINLSKEGLRLKHFKSDLVAWEDKEEMVKFELLDYDENTLVFDALKIYKVDDDNIKMELRLNNKGEIKIETFQFARQK